MAESMQEIDYSYLEADFLLSDEPPDMTIRRGGGTAVAESSFYKMPIVAGESRRNYGEVEAADKAVGRAPGPGAVYRSGEWPALQGEAAAGPRAAGGAGGGRVPPQEPPIAGGGEMPESEGSDENDVSRLWRDPAARHALWGPIRLKDGRVVGESHGPDYQPPVPEPASASIFDELAVETAQTRIEQVGERIGRFLRFRRGVQLGHEVHTAQAGQEDDTPATDNTPTVEIVITTGQTEVEAAPLLPDSAFPAPGEVLPRAEKAELDARRGRGDVGPDFNAVPEAAILERILAGLRRDGVAPGQSDPEARQRVTGMAVEDLTNEEIAAAGGDAAIALAAKMTEMLPQIEPEEGIGPEDEG